MKKLLLFGFWLLICCLLLVNQRQLTSVSAQNASGDKSGKSNGAAARSLDKELAESIKKLTNRSAEGLKVETTEDGMMVDLQGRFQNVMLSKIDTDGEPAAACVTDLNEANSFFGRNLETGEFVPSYQYQKDYTLSPASRHGMSEREFEFYKRLIETAAERKAVYPESATITIVNNDGAGEGFNDTTAKSAEGGNSGATLGQQRLNLFNYAASIWGAYLDTNVQINIEAQFNSLSPCSSSGGVLGSAGTKTVHGNFTNAEFINTWYHAALANKRKGSDLDSATNDMSATFNSSVDSGCLGSGTRFYYGLNNSTPAGTTNLLVVLLHEMGHGFGFSSFVNGSTGALFSGFPDVYTRYMYDQTTNKYWYQMTDAERQVSALNTNNVYWDGPNVKAASNFLTAGYDAATGRVQLFTPNPFQSGSSISHFSTSATQNLLMEPSINTGLPLTLDLTRQQMRDIGWYRDRNGDGTADTITNINLDSNPVIRNSQTTVTWTNSTGFSENVTIELSLDGGTTYPTVIASNVANTGSYTFTAPDITTSQARIRVREYSFMSPLGASSNFNIQLAPTAASATVSGRVTDNKGQEISRATISLIDMQGNPQTVRTNQFGYFRFEGVTVGESYVLSAMAKGYVFEPRVVGVNQDVAELSITSVSRRR